MFNTAPTSKPANLSEWWDAQKNPLAQVMGLCGAVLLFLGLFAPVVSAPVIGNVSYLQSAKPEGSYIFGSPSVLMWCAIGSLFCVCVRIYSILWLAGLAALVTTVIGFIGLQYLLSDDVARAQQQAQENPFGGLAVAMAASVQPQWGWGVLILGAILITAAAAVADLNSLTKRLQSAYGDG